MKRLKINLLVFGLTALCLLAFTYSVSAQTGERRLQCDSREDYFHGSRFCEMREQTLAANGNVSVDGQRNGGVRVSGWDRNDVLMRAKVEAWGETDSETRALVSQIRIETGGNRISAAAPSNANDNPHWAVSYEIFVPKNSDLSLKTYNGGISVADIKGQINFNAHNGGVSLSKLAGTVKGTTTNGGVHITLSGDRWDGDTLDVRTTNGGVQLSIPANYSAHLETATTNGRLSIDFPITVQGRIGKELSTDLGGGGKTIRAVTTNGGVHISRQS